MNPRTIILLTLALLAGTNIRAADGAASEDPAAQLPSGVKVLFSPEDSIDATIVRLINGANAQILFNQRAITNPAILQALVDAFARRKVYVAGILDRDPPVQNYTTPAYLATNGIPVYYASGAGSNAVNYLIIDRQIVAAGSYEWTMNAQRKNKTNCLIISEPTIAASYISHFTRTLERGKPVTEPETFVAP